MNDNAIRIRENTRISIPSESEKIHECQCYQNRRKYKNINTIRIIENTKSSNAIRIEDKCNNSKATRINETKQ